MLFVFQLREGPPDLVKPEGLDPQANYRLRALNLPDGAKSACAADGKVLPGADLMNNGIAPSCSKPLESTVLKLVKEP